MPEQEGSAMSPPLWRNRGLRRFVKGATAALGKLGPPPLWGRGLRRFGEAGVSAALGQGLRDVQLSHTDATRGGLHSRPTT